MTWTGILAHSRQVLLRTCVAILAKLMKQTVIEKPTISQDFAYLIPRIPISASWCLTWQRRMVPITFHLQRHWYKQNDTSLLSDAPEGTIIVRSVAGGAPRYAQIRKGSQLCLHTPEEGITVKESNVLEARLCGKPGSVFHHEFPEGVEIGHLLRLPTFAKVSEILPSILVPLSTVQARIMYEDPQLLYIYILLDDTFDEVTLGCDDVLTL